MKRRAFTLVELLVVIAIIVVLLALVLRFLPKRESVATRDTAGKIEAYIAGAKARALRDQRPISVRFLSPDGGQTFTQLQLVDNGENLAPIDKPYYDWKHGGSSQGVPEPPKTVYLDLPDGENIRLANQNNNPVVVGNTVRQVGHPLQGWVEVGDLLEIVETTPPSVHRITAIDFATNTLTLQATKAQGPNGWDISGIPSVSCMAAVRLSWNYRYIRKPRPLLGELPLEFNKDVVVQGVNPGVVPSSLNLQRGRSGEYEITFAPGGEVVGSNGRIVLWVRDTNGVAKPVLLAIYPTSGMKSHDVGPAGDEFRFTQDGR